MIRGESPRKLGRSRGITLGFTLALMILAGIAWLLLRDTRMVALTNDRVIHTHEVILQIEITRSQSAIAESGERAYMITGDDSYLEQYATAVSSVDQSLERLDLLTADNPSQQNRVAMLRAVSVAMLATMAKGIESRREGGLDAAQQFVGGGRVKREMDEILAQALAIEGVERELLAQRIAKSRAGTRKSIVTFVAGLAASFALLLSVFWFLNRQISIRRRAEEALTLALEEHRVLFDSAVDVICSVDAKGRFISINPACLQLWGYSREELIGRRYIELVVPDDVAATDEVADQIMAGKKETDFENRYVRKDGSQVRMMWTASWSESHQLMFAVGRDISERKRNEEAIEKKSEELARSNDELQQFAYVASHDLQEPLRMVASYTQLLASRYEGRLDSDAQEFIGYAVDGAARMQRLIQDLLSFSRVESQGKMLRETSSEDALAGALLNLSRAIEESGAVVSHEPLPTVLADDTQLLQLFQNLVGNALKYRNAEIPQIHVKATRNGNREWTFAVRDNGIGINPKHFNRIFVMFQRLHGREEFSGTGIGLAVCKKIVERHGGHIWVESESDHGSTFKFTLPEMETK